MENSSTPQDPGKGILDGLQNQQIGGVDYLRFGTTIATNAILERNGATVAFVTTLALRMFRLFKEENVRATTILVGLSLSP